MERCPYWRGAGIREVPICKRYKESVLIDDRTREASS